MIKTLMLHLIQSFKFQEGCVVNDSLVTSLFIFLLIAYQLTHKRHHLVHKLNQKLKESVNLSNYVIFSSLQVIPKEIAAIQNCEIAGWQKCK